MSQIPIVIPLLVTGAFLGSVWKSKELRAVWKKAVLASAVSGILNAVYALLLGVLGISGNSARTNVSGSIPTANISGNVPSTNNSIAFVVTCGLTGFFVVLAVFFSAVGMIWYRRRKEIEPTE